MQLHEQKGILSSKEIYVNKPVFTEIQKTRQKYTTSMLKYIA